jgi:hypothetical protein
MDPELVWKRWRREKFTPNHVLLLASSAYPDDGGSL